MPSTHDNSFIKKKLHRFRELGAVAPSSRYLARQMVSHIEVREKLMVIELGPGTGAFTKAILLRLPASGRLIALEINEKAAKHLAHNIQDSRLEIVNTDATNLSTYLHKKGIQKVDCIISGLPLGNFPPNSVQHLLFEIKNILNSTGVYVQFQYFLSSLHQIKKTFPHVSIRFEPRNFPPAFVLVCKKSKSV